LLEVAIAGFAFPLLDEEKSPRPIALAISQSLPPGRAIGVYDLKPIEGGLGDYGDRPIVSLANEIAVAEFLEKEGRILLLRSRHFEGFTPLFKLSALVSFREGRRKLILAQVASKQSSP
jgi:hypothetical protein